MPAHRLWMKSGASGRAVNFFYPAGLSYAPAPEFQRYLVSVGTPLVRL